MLIFYKEYTLDEGFEALSKFKGRGEVDGLEVSAPSGIVLFRHYHDTCRDLNCWKCGVKADRFILKHHPNDMKKPPVMELYAYNGKYFNMMTRDHIIPKSLGGNNEVDNLRPACEPCNRKRGNVMNKEDTAFMLANPHLWSAK